MTVNEFKAKNPKEKFYLKGTRGHFFHFGCMDMLIPEVYESKILKIGKTKKGVTGLVIDYDFLA